MTAGTTRKARKVAGRTVAVWLGVSLMAALTAGAAAKIAAASSDEPTAAPAVSHSLTAIKDVAASETVSVATRLVDAYDAIANHPDFRGTANEDLPDAMGDGFDLGGVKIIAGTSTNDPVVHNGFYDYGKVAEGYGVLAASDGPGMDRFGLVIDDAEMEDLALDVTIPDGADVSNEDSGAIKVTADDGTESMIAPATAVDSAGKKVPASYKIVDDQMQIKVELDSAVLPVMVDPVSANYWWGHRDWYSRSDVRWQADYWAVISIAKRVCGANWVCKQTVDRYTDWIYNTWQYAKNTNQCLTMDQLWTGQVTSIRAYGCTWG